MKTLQFIERRKTILLFVVLMVAVYFPLFLQIDRLPIRVWDESIMGVNAYRMLENHDYIVTYFGNTPDMSNTKPPFHIWCIVLCSKVLGFSELSMRLPSALAALVLCIYLFVTLRRYTGSNVFGFFVVLVLVTSQGYVTRHGTRTGEYDSTLTLFSTLFALHLFLATEAEEARERSRHLLLVFVFMTFAVLTKGIACMMQAPALLVYALARKKVFTFLKTGTFYIGLAILLVFGLGFYFLRESQNPGYMHAVWMNELGGRYAEANEGHKGPFMFYFDAIVYHNYTAYVGFLLMGIVTSLLFAKGPIKRLVVFCVTAAAFFWFIISSAQTKLPWYDTPVYPYFAIISASFVYFVYTTAKERLQSKNLQATGAKIAALAISLLLFVLPYTNIILEKAYCVKPEWWEADFAKSCEYFQKAVRHQEDATGQKFVFDFDGDFAWHRTIVWCYRRQLQEKKIDAQFLEPADVAVNDTVMLFEGQTTNVLHQKFDMVYLNHVETGNADRWFVKDIKQSVADSTLVN